MFLPFSFWDLMGARKWLKFIKKKKKKGKTRPLLQHGLKLVMCESDPRSPPPVGWDYRHELGFQGYTALSGLCDAGDGIQGFVCAHKHSIKVHS